MPERTATLTFFASAAEAAGQPSMDVPVHDGDTYRDVLPPFAGG